MRPEFGLDSDVFTSQVATKLVEVRDAISQVHTEDWSYSVLGQLQDTGQLLVLVRYQVSDQEPTELEVLL